MHGERGREKERGKKFGKCVGLHAKPLNIFFYIKLWTTHCLIFIFKKNMANVMLSVGLVFDDQKVTRKLDHEDFMLKNLIFN
jgi:hypothetical protein